jgi:predicted permease
MAGITDILFSLTLIATGLSLGYLYRNQIPHGVTRSEAEINQLRKRLQATALLYVNPIAFGGAIWVLNLDDIRIISLPFLGALAIILGGILAYLAAKALRLSRKQTGVFVTCGSFTNIGSIGSLVTFILLGEQAVALMPFYKLFETLLYYGIGFPLAKSMSDMVLEYESPLSRVKSVLSDRFVLVSVASMALGLGLNLTGYTRPAFYSTLNSFLIPLGTLLLLSSIGMAMRFGRMSGYLREVGVISLIKFIAVPGAVYLVASFLGLGYVDGGLPLKASVVLASMPVAFTAMVPPTLYDLDVDLANTAWFVTTALLLFVVPALWILLE